MKSTILKSTMLLSAFAVAGFAETVTIRVPFEFSAAGKTLPAGEYRFQEETPGVMIITGETASSSMLMLTRESGDPASAKAGVTFRSNRSLATISMPDGKKVELLRK